MIPLLLPSFPSKVKRGWSEEEKRVLVRREHANYTSIHHEKYEFKKVGRCLLELRFWLYTCMYGANHFCLSSLTFFLLTIIEVRSAIARSSAEANESQSFDYSAADSQLLSVAVNICMAVSVVFFSILSDRTGRRAPWLLGTMSIATLGYALLLGLKSKGGRFAAVILVGVGINPSITLVLTWTVGNVPGYFQRCCHMLPTGSSSLTVVGEHT